MANRVLRDHSEPCPKCGWLTPLIVKGRVALEPVCRECGSAGGREVTIDYEAANELARTFRNLEWNARAVRVVVDAALEET